MGKYAPATQHNVGDGWVKPQPYLLLRSITVTDMSIQLTFEISGHAKGALKRETTLDAPTPYLLGVEHTLRHV